jgi:O-antigen ligase
MIWFGALFRAIYDLWAATLLYSIVTFLGLIFCLGRWRDAKPIKIPFVLPVLFFMIALVLSFQFSYDRDTTYLEAWGWFFTFLAFYLFINVVEHRADIDRFFRWAGLIVVPLLLICLWQRFVYPGTGHTPTLGLFGYGELLIPFGWIHPGWHLALRYGHWEIHATLINSVILAGFILNWVFYFWTQAPRSFIEKGLASCSLLILILARSWWALAIFLLGLALFYGFPRGWRSMNRKFWLRLLPVALCLLIAVYFKIHHHALTTDAIRSYNPKSRWIYWVTAIKMWKSHPWTGVGLGAYATAYPLFRVAAVENTRFAHGFLLQLFAETGLVGFLMFIYGFYEYMKKRRGMLSFAEPSRSEVALDITLVALFLYSLISIHMDYLLNRFTVFMVLGSTIALSSVPSVQPKKIWLVLMSTSLVLVGAFWLPLLPASQCFISGLQFEQEGNTAGAIRQYEQAIHLDPYLAEGYGRLAYFHQAQFERTGSPDELTTALRYSQEAFRCKKESSLIELHDHLLKIAATHTLR